MIRPPPRSTLFPSTTLSRSHDRRRGAGCGRNRDSGIIDREGEIGVPAAWIKNRDLLCGRRAAAEIAAKYYVGLGAVYAMPLRSEEHTSELQSQSNLVCRLLL